MANKRTHLSAFSQDLQKKESPYAFYGTPLPPLDGDSRDDGSYVPVWQQEVRDERGRKRLHGAFTGGFSAGYYNTVGSKEGWTPQAFVSSRTKRAGAGANASQKAEDFMDEEDIADAEDAKRLRTSAGYGGLGIGGAEEVAGTIGNAILDVMRPAAEESVGIKLLQKMGWRMGQGVGPKIRRKARDVDDGHGADDRHGQEHLFAPDNSAMIRFNRKSDFKGLGYEGELSLPRTIQDSFVTGRVGDAKEEEEDEEAAWSRSRAKFKTAGKKRPKKINPSFGVGILNDTGSDDEDAYGGLGPKISYNRTIGGDTQEKASKAIKKKTAPVVGGANPLLASRPVFMSRKAGGSKTSMARGGGSGFRKCHDGLLPLSGFLLAMQALDISPLAKYPPPTIPPEWTARKSRWDVKPASQIEAEYTSTSSAAKASSLDPKARAAALGEEQLQGKSIFDYITPAARDRLAKTSGNTALPRGKGEEAPARYRLSLTDEEKTKQLWHSVPQLAQHVAREALERGASGWMPYADDAGKRARYRAFLELKAGISVSKGDVDVLPERAKGTSKEDWTNEMREFAQAAEVFRPITGAMASRFTSSRGTFQGGDTDDGSQPLLSNPAEKPRDAAEEAAKLGMYGAMTRSVVPFYPTRLLCKRFNVRPPANVAVDPNGEYGADEKKEVKEMVPRKAIERMMQDAAVRRFESRGYEGGNSETATPRSEHDDRTVEIETAVEETVINPEKNEALEQERPGDAVFKAIFGSDSEDD